MCFGNIKSSPDYILPYTQKQIYSILHGFWKNVLDEVLFFIFNKKQLFFTIKLWNGNKYWLSSIVHQYHWFDMQSVAGEGFWGKGWWPERQNDRHTHTWWQYIYTFGQIWQRCKNCYIGRIGSNRESCYADCQCCSWMRPARWKWVTNILYLDILLVDRCLKIMSMELGQTCVAALQTQGCPHQTRLTNLRLLIILSLQREE